MEAPGLADVDQVALIVHMEHRLDVQHSAHNGRGRADPAAPLEIHQVVHRKPVAQVQTVVQQPLLQLPKAQALVPLLAGIVGKQALAQRGAQAVHHGDGPLRIALPQLLSRDTGRLVGGGQA